MLKMPHSIEDRENFSPEHGQTERIAKEGDRKKKKKRKKVNVALTSRDDDIFIVLMAGPKKSQEIRERLLSIGKDRGNSHFNYDLLPVTLRSRITKLMGAEYLISRRYPATGEGTEGSENTAFSLYALTENAKNRLVKRGYKSSHIRMAFPHGDRVEHEELLIQAMEKMMEDERILKLDLEFEDENALKGKTRGGKEGIRYPDLHVVLALTKEGKKIVKDIALEIDNDSMQAKEVFAKIKEQHEQRDWLTVLLCPNEERVAKLKAVFAKQIDESIAWIKGMLSRKISETFKKELGQKLDMLTKLNTRVLFAVHKVFCKFGLKDTEWMNIENRRAHIIPKDYIPL